MLVFDTALNHNEKRDIQYTVLTEDFPGLVIFDRYNRVQPFT